MNLRFWINSPPLRLLFCFFFWLFGHQAYTTQTQLCEKRVLLGFVKRVPIFEQRFDEFKKIPSDKKLEVGACSRPLLSCGYFLDVCLRNLNLTMESIGSGPNVFFDHCDVVNISEFYKDKKFQLIVARSFPLFFGDDESIKVWSNMVFLSLLNQITDDGKIIFLYRVPESAKNVLDLLLKGKGGLGQKIHLLISLLKRGLRGKADLRLVVNEQERHIGIEIVNLPTPL